MSRRKTPLRLPAALALGSLALGVACDRNVLHTGSVAPVQTVAPPVPMATHSDGTCDSGLQTCPGAGAGFCFDLQTAPDHCGSCDNACPLGTPCQNGQCRGVACTTRVTVKALRVNGSPAWRYQVGVADFDRDGELDLLIPTSRMVIANGAGGPFEETSASVFRGQGDGTFVVATSFPAAENPKDSIPTFPLAVADFNRDQIADVVVGAVSGGVDASTVDRAAMVVHLGNGDGTFGPGIDVVGGSVPGFIAVADLDGDGTPDLATVGTPNEAVTVRHGNGDGSFGPPRDLEVGGTPTYVSVTDWNSDGVPDLIATDTYVHLLYGTGGGSFAPVLDCALNMLAPTGEPGPPVLGDFDHDGLVNLVSNNSLLMGMHDCNFTRQTTFHVSYASAMPMAAGDFNGDGATDLAVAVCEGVGYLAGDGHGNLGNLVMLGDLDAEHPQCNGTTGMAGDFNGDGRLDLVVAGLYSIRVFMNTCR